MSGNHRRNVIPLDADGTITLLFDVWCDECGGYIACDLPSSTAERLTELHWERHQHDTWIDPSY